MSSRWCRMFSNDTWIEGRLRLVDYYNAARIAPSALTCCVWAPQLLGCSILRTSFNNSPSPIERVPMRSLQRCTGPDLACFEKRSHQVVNNHHLSKERLLGKALHLRLCGCRTVVFFFAICHRTWSCGELQSCDGLGFCFSMMDNLFSVIGNFGNFDFIFSWKGFCEPKLGTGNETQR